MSTNAATGDTDLRLDKWLWTARFFKTRRQAVKAINGGKVQVNGQRTKPGKVIQAGTHLVIHKGSLQWDLLIKGISRQRRPASEAALLYEESEESRLRRQALVQERRERGAAAPGASDRPNKRDRRMIHRFTRKSDA